MNQPTLLLLLALAACSGSTTSPSTTPTSGASDAAAPSGGGGGQEIDSGSGAGTNPGGGSSGDAGDVVTPPGAGADDGGLGGAAACDAGTCGSVSGVVQRTATKPTHGGKGSVYVAIFDGNPITSQATAKIVGRALLPGEDLTSDTAQVAYRVDGVPVRAAAYQVIAFLDDANAVTASNPAPASGDLVSLDLSAGFAGVAVTVAIPGDVTLNLPLNVAMP